MKELSKERMGEIALLSLKSDAKKDRIPDIENLKRNLGNKVNELGVPAEELLSFWVSVYSEIFKEILSQAESVNFKKISQQKTLLKKGDKVVGFIGYNKEN